MEHKPLLTTEEAKALAEASTHAQKEEVMGKIVLRMRVDLRTMEQQERHARSCHQASCDHDWKSWGNWEKMCEKCGLVTSN
ncbi:hypothetical protein VPHD249_0117 [Vibrio phage D249]|nr:hypothetical protein SIPHO036v1_80020 [Vibrio phage 70E38.1]QZI88012.1 hypothetical protein SIPHO041v1_p0101 [Vibrio phage 234P1]QZI88184.1 hypothetical protein SIPHO035v1_p0093 [Vibrio phage 234P7B]QZI88348.1 hypothetical protein SIPHO082v1_p0071 [Vibrio phage 294E48.1]QZI88551.1 hypothetical protein SIPHO037v1_p0110 [Vibrio phage 70E35.2]QZI88736.1 hypothetical protein SIPHO039v1_p0107 [Vibrio phage 70E35.5a]QZI88919.1 hypothetical protein SIPHO040v1_p0106 [Vibrio phage 70E35.6]QZI89101